MGRGEIEAMEKEGDGQREGEKFDILGSIPIRGHMVFKGCTDWHLQESYANEQRQA